jgi:hypothetical protein
MKGLPRVEPLTSLQPAKCKIHSWDWGEGEAVWYDLPLLITVQSLTGFPAVFLLWRTIPTSDSGNAGNRSITRPRVAIELSPIPNMSNTKYEI